MELVTFAAMRLSDGTHRRIRWWCRPNAVLSVCTIALVVLSALVFSSHVGVDATPTQSRATSPWHSSAKVQQSTLTTRDGHSTVAGAGEESDRDNGRSSAVEGRFFLFKGTAVRYIRS